MGTNELVITQRLAFDFCIRDSRTSEREMEFHYEPEPNVSVEDAKAIVRGYLTNLTKGIYRGIVVINTDDDLEYRFNGGYFRCCRWFFGDVPSRDLESVLRELGSGSITEPTEEWSIESKYSGHFTYTDETGYKFEVSETWAKEPRWFHVPWNLRSYSDEGVIKAYYPGIIVTTPPKQELDLTNDVSRALVTLLEPPLRKCADLFKEIGPWLKENHESV